jgi:2-oxoglutarate ferredoxin oxidoreductase subunit delta
MATETKAKKKKKKKYRIMHNHELCKGCGLCIAFCPTGGIEADILGKAQFVGEDKCIGCKRCVWYCPEFANWVEEIEEEEEGQEGEPNDNDEK